MGPGDTLCIPPGTPHRIAAGEGPEGPRKTTLLNASINTFHYREGRWSLHCWGDIGHLGRDRALDDV